DTVGLEPPRLALFAAPPVAGLAARIAASRSEQREGAAPRAREHAAMRAAPRGQELRLPTAQERVWFLQQLDPANRSYQFQATLRLRGDLDVTALERSLEEIVRRHEILRTTFPAVDGRPIQSIHPPAPLHLPLIDFEALAA